VELAVFWSGVKEYRLQNQDTEGKLIWSNADCNFRMFLLSFLLSGNLTIEI